MVAAAGGEVEPSRLPGSGPMRRRRKRRRRLGRIKRERWIRSESRLGEVVGEGGEECSPGQQLRLRIWRRWTRLDGRRRRL
jgi:hypothetical protein